MRRTVRSVAAISVAALLLLTGCGAGASSTTAGGTPSGTPSSGALSQAQVRDVLACLRAAGITQWSDLEASSSPSSPPTGVSSPGPIHFPAGLRFTQPKVAKALRACRITLPGFAPSGGLSPG